MKAPEFDYRLARTPQEALDLLAGEGDIRVLAGGQSLVAALNLRLSQPDLLVDIGRLNEWKGIAATPTGLRIGALTTHAEIAGSALIAEHAPLLSMAAPFIAHPGIRNRGTLGGSLCLADPAAEWPACLVALDAVMNLARVGETRSVPARAFFQDIYETALEPGEILTHVEIPAPRGGTLFAFDEIARRPGDFAMAGLAMALRMAQGHIVALDLGYLGLGNTPLAAFDFAQQCIGLSVEDACERARTLLPQELSPPSDHHASAAYREQIAVTLTQRLLRRLAAQAEKSS